VEFTRACDEGELERALDLYEGELMPGFHLPDCGDYDAWIEGERNDLRERAVSAAWALAQVLERDLKRTLAGQWARRAVQYAGTDERVLRRTMGDVRSRRRPRRRAPALRRLLQAPPQGAGRRSVGRDERARREPAQAEA
jgi:DNA-binding SARP family transcriptional activator